jgi:hypothetical protein
MGIGGLLRLLLLNSCKNDWRVNAFTNYGFFVIDAFVKILRSLVCVILAKVGIQCFK